MNITAASLWALVLRTFKDPKPVAEDLIKLRFEHSFLWMFLGLVVICSVLVMVLASAIGPPPPPEMKFLSLSPFAATMMIGSLSVMFVFVLYYVGLAMGGTGSFGSTLVLLSWHQAVSLVFQLFQLLAVLISPTLGAFTAMAGFVALIYVFLQFINALNEFESIGKSIGVLLISAAGLLFGLAIILSIIGVTAEGLV